MTEPLEKTPRSVIRVTTSPAPAWSGHVFVCDDCLATHVLEAGDECISLGGGEFLTPECPAPGCGYVTTIQLPARVLAMLRLGLTQGSDQEHDHEHEQEQVGNAS